MFKYFVALIALVLLLIGLAVVTLTSPFICIYACISLFRKQPEKESPKGNLLLTLLKDYATNNSKINRPRQTVRGSEVGGVRRFTTECENNEPKPS